MITILSQQTGALEAAHAQKHGKLISLSEQQLIDCCTLRNFGCDAGLVTFAFQCIEHFSRGIESEADYPYKAQVRSVSGSEKGAFYVATGIVQRQDVSILYAVILTSPRNIIRKDTSWSNILL